MTDSPVDIEALIARMRDAAGSPYTQPEHSDVIEAGIRALESTRAKAIQYRDELRQERERADELRKLSRRWQEVVNATGFVEAVEAEARGYHDSACAYQADLARAREVIEKVRALPRHALNALVTGVDAREIDAILATYDQTTNHESPQ